MNIRFLTVPMALAVALVAGCAGGVDDENYVEVQDNEYDPGTMDVTEGTTLTFENVGESEHTVTIQREGVIGDDTEKDEELAPGDSTTYTFSDPGAYEVMCRIHTGMTMSVMVE